MSLQKHYQLQRHHLDLAQQYAAARDRTQLNLRLKRQSSALGFVIVENQIRKIIYQLTIVQQHTAAIEKLEGRYVNDTAGDIELSAYPLTYEERKALADEAKLATSKHKARTYPIKHQTAACSACDGTGTSNLSTPGQEETCTACDGTGYAA